MAEGLMEPGLDSGAREDGVIRNHSHIPQPYLFAVISGQVHLIWGRTKGCQSSLTFHSTPHQVQWEIGFSPPAGLAHPHKVPRAHSGQAETIISQDSGFHTLFSVCSYLATVSLAHLFLAYLAMKSRQDSIYTRTGSTKTE